MERPTFDQLLEHEYDGIREYNNPPPGWMNMLFLGSVVFSIFYFLFFHVGTAGWTLDESHQAAVAENQRVRFADVGELTVDQPTLLKCMNTPDWLTSGAAVFETHCKECHAADGSGLIGPNLTDDHYKNVRTLLDITKVVENGAANGSMPTFAKRLSTNEIVLVSAFVATMRGQNLSGPRGEEGDVIAPWPTMELIAPASKITPNHSGATLDR